MIAGEKVTMAPQTVDFFNANSYPLVIILLLVAGFCMQYKKSTKVESMKILGITTIPRIFIDSTLVLFLYCMQKPATSNNIITSGYELALKKSTVWGAIVTFSPAIIYWITGKVI